MSPGRADTTTQHPALDTSSNVQTSGMADTIQTGRNRSPERTEFLGHLMNAALNHNGYGFAGILEWKDDGNGNEYAIIFDAQDTPEDTTCTRCSLAIRPRGMFDIWTGSDGSTSCGDPAGSHDPVRETWRVDLDTIAKGLGIIRNAVMREVPNDGKVPHNKATGDRLGYGGESRRLLLLADRTNGEDGDYDVVGALATLECALFGRVIYG